MKIRAQGVLTAVGGTFIIMTSGCSTTGHLQMSKHFEDFQQSRFVQLPFVKDAQNRWAVKNGSTVERAFVGRTIQVMHFPGKSCVQFAFSAPSVGGVPIYCYRSVQDKPTEPLNLIEEYSDVD